MPSLNEGFGLPIIEAQSFGIPAIVSDCTAMPEVAGDGALLINPLSLNSITKAMERIVSDPMLHKHLSKKANINSKRFSWARTAELTMSAFRMAIRQHKNMDRKF